MFKVLRDILHAFGLDNRLSNYEVPDYPTRSDYILSWCHSNLEIAITYSSWRNLRERVQKLGVSWLGCFQYHSYLCIFLHSFLIIYTSFSGHISFCDASPFSET
jgi:hypothetical protein